jgi:hypothetical protein
MSTIIQNDIDWRPNLRYFGVGKCVVHLEPAVGEVFASYYDDLVWCDYSGPVEPLLVGEVLCDGSK